jgi:hypothetical protein
MYWYVIQLWKSWVDYYRKQQHQELKMLIRLSIISGLICLIICSTIVFMCFLIPVGLYFAINLTNLTTRIVKLTSYLSVCLSVCLSICLFICGSKSLCWTLAAFLDSWLFTQSIGLFGRGMSPSQGRYLHTEQHKQNKHTQTSMPWVWFEPKIPVVLKHIEAKIHKLRNSKCSLSVFCISYTLYATSDAAAAGRKL